MVRNGTNSRLSDSSRNNLIASGKRPTRVICRPDLALDHLHLLPERALEKLGGYFHAALEHGAVFDPLPDLRAGDLGGRRVFHEIVDRHRAAPAQPGLDILYADADIVAQARFGAWCPL